MHKVSVLDRAFPKQDDPRLEKLLSKLEPIIGEVDRLGLYLQKKKISIAYLRSITE